MVLVSGFIEPLDDTVVFLFGQKHYKSVKQTPFNSQSRAFSVVETSNPKKGESREEKQRARILNQNIAA